MNRLLAKRSAILAITLGAVISLIGWSQHWVTLRLSSVDIRVDVVDATGQNSTSLPAGLALVALATGLVLLTAHRVLAYIIGIVNLAVGLSIVTICFSFTQDPVSFQFKQLSSLSGISDDAALRSLVAAVTIGFGVWVTLLGGIIIMLGALSALAGAQRWPARRSRYERTRTKAATRDDAARIETIDAWDEMTRGDDPTS